MAVGTTNVGFEDKLWLAADKLRGSMDASEYKHVVLGLIFLKYVSDAFGEKYSELVKEGSGFEEDKDEYTGYESNYSTVTALIHNSGHFNVVLSQEEINILSTYMVVEWLGQQLATIENVRMKYSGTDFKFTSQANHMQKILQLKQDYEREGFHLQRLYKRRKVDNNGMIKSTLGEIMGGDNL